ncbi:hypothetical protein D3C71_1979100 [compost metagenome]
MSTGIQPGETAAQQFNGQFATFQIHLVNAGNFQLATGGRLDLFGKLHHLTVVEVQAGHRPVGLGLDRFFFDR